MSDRYGPAVRNGGTQYSTCYAAAGGTIVPGAEDLPILSGSVTDTSAPGVRRTIDLELAPVPGLFDLLAPTGMMLYPASVLRYPNGVTERVPMGVFEIDSVSKGYGSNGSIKVTGSDRWGRIQRARFLNPNLSVPGAPVVQQMAALIRETFGSNELVVYATNDRTAVGSLVWDEDRGKALNEMAESIGCRVSFDRNGVATIEDLPTVGSQTPSVWTVDASSSGVLLDAERARDRQKTYNVVLVNGENIDGVAPFPPQLLWDSDPTSPTYAGTNPYTAANVGPFGIVPYKYTSPLLVDGTQAQKAGAAILARVTGLNAQLSLSAVRMHALDSLDAIDVVLPRERYDMPIPVERHLIDKVVHPLTPDGVMSIETRSTRSDDV